MSERISIRRGTLTLTPIPYPGGHGAQPTSMVTPSWQPTVDRRCPLTGVEKFKEVQKGATGEGAVSGERTYYAVGIKYEGRNHEDQVFVQGTSTVYLPSREGGMVTLPIPHVAEPPTIPYETFYRDWY